MSRNACSALLAVFAVVITACADGEVAPAIGDRLTGFSVGEIKDTAVSGGTPGVPSGTGPVQVGGTVKGVGTGSDTLATAPKLADVVVKAYQFKGYSGNDVLIGDEIGSFTTDANGWYGYFSMAPGKYVVTFTPPATSAFRSIYVTWDSPGAPAGTAVASVWSIFLPRK